MKNPYAVIKSRYVTEKSNVLQSLKDAQSNKSLKKCNKPKYVFLVAKEANKKEIAKAIEDIYSEKKIKVKAVNTINVKPKQKFMRGRRGKTQSFKKAIVTLSEGDALDEAV